MSLLRAHALRTLSTRHLPPLTRTMTTSTPTTTSTTPLEDSIRSKLTTLLSPTLLQIHNDSHKHAHHAAMRANASLPTPNLETHFRLLIVSDAFEGKRQPARHRIVYGALAEEMGVEGGVHALQITTRTVGEEGGVGVVE